MVSVHESAPAVGPPLDWEDLESRCLGRVELVTKVLRAFHIRFAEDFELLQQTLADGDYEAAAFIAHRMKGTARTAAATSLARCCAAIEEHCSESLSLEVSPLISDFHRQWRDVENAVLGFLARKPDPVVGQLVRI